MALYNGTDREINGNGTNGDRTGHGRKGTNIFLALMALTLTGFCVTSLLRPAEKIPEQTIGAGKADRQLLPDLKSVADTTQTHPVTAGK